MSQDLRTFFRGPEADTLYWVNAAATDSRMAAGLLKGALRFDGTLNGEGLKQLGFSAVVVRRPQRSWRFLLREVLPR